MFESYIGTIVKLPSRMQVKGWIPCHGQSLQIQFYSALYALIQNTYGSESVLTFKE